MMYGDESIVGPASANRAAGPMDMGCLPLYELQKWVFPKEAGGVTVVGHSRAAEGTGFSIAELGWILDAGVLSNTVLPEHIFLTHMHTDHVHQLVYLKSRRKPPVIYAPQESVPFLERYLTVAQELTSHKLREHDENWTVSYHMQGVVPGDSFRIKRGGRAFLVEVVACDHTVACVGYRFSALRDKLKPAYHGLPGEEIAALRKQGECLTEELCMPMFAYLGDTTPAVFANAPALLDTPLVMVECTFLEASHQENAERTKHTSWDELLPIIEAHPETTFVLMHFSLRYRLEEIHAFFEGKLPANAVCWLGR